MEETLYNAGAAMTWVIPALVAVFCIYRIRRNRAEIKRLEAEIEREERIKKNNG